MIRNDVPPALMIIGSCQVVCDVPTISSLPMVKFVPLTMDTLNLAKKVYDMLNRIAISGGTY